MYRSRVLQEAGGVVSFRHQQLPPHEVLASNLHHVQTVSALAATHQQTVSNIVVWSAPCQLAN